MRGQGSVARGEHRAVASHVGDGEGYRGGRDGGRGGVAAEGGEDDSLFQLDHSSVLSNGHSVASQVSQTAAVLASISAKEGLRRAASSPEYASRGDRDRYGNEKKKQAAAAQREGCGGLQ